MQKGSTQDYNNLYDAILSLQSREECAAFFEDLFTISEISAAVQRLKVAGMLYEKQTCNAVAEKTGASTATVSRVNKCLHYGAGGYRLVLERREK
ncbi:MAG: TrpR-like protein YerC/YecD [Clostridiales bacterium]|jgi:TrpR-related protein YerC/YecD|nr:TrpR-like protein YerC/YecD [Clostridiales bacterium]